MSNVILMFFFLFKNQSFKPKYPLPPSRNDLPAPSGQLPLRNPVPRFQICTLSLPLRSSLSHKLSFISRRQEDRRPPELGVVSTHRKGGASLGRLDATRLWMLLRRGTRVAGMGWMLQGNETQQEKRGKPH